MDDISGVRMAVCTTDTYDGDSDISRATHMFTVNKQFPVLTLNSKFPLDTLV